MSSKTENSDAQRKLDEYNKNRNVNRNNDYTFTIEIDNETDSNFDDSIFAWDYKDQGGGGMVTGHAFPPYTLRAIQVPSGGCVKSGGGDLYEGSERLKLEGYTDPGQDLCWTTWGWRIFYEDRTTKKIKVVRVDQTKKQV